MNNMRCYVFFKMKHYVTIYVYIHIYIYVQNIHYNTYHVHPDILPLPTSQLLKCMFKPADFSKVPSS